MFCRGCPLLAKTLHNDKLLQFQLPTPTCFIEVLEHTSCKARVVPCFLIHPNLLVKLFDSSLITVLSGNDPYAASAHTPSSKREPYITSDPRPPRAAFGCVVYPRDPTGCSFEQAVKPAGVVDEL